MARQGELIRDALVATGYEFVQLEPRMSDVKSSWRPDVVAWAADVGGTLVPWAAVENKKSSVAIQPEVILSALARARDLLGTVDHYVVVNGDEWYLADPGLQRLARVDGPEAPPYGGEGEIADVDLVTNLLAEHLWRAASRSRHSAAPLTAPPFDPEAALDFKGFRTLSNVWIPIRKDALWQGRRRAVVEFARRGREAGMFTSQRAIAVAVAQLVGAKLDEDVLDPFCGTGSFLWEAIEYAREHGTGLRTVLGYDINERMIEVAGSIGESAPLPVEIVRGDALEIDLLSAKAVISAPPFGLRLQGQVELLGGTTTRDGDLAIIDRLVRALGDGGRAVLHLPVGVTFRSTGEDYRHFLASNFRIDAIIGLPQGAVPGISIRSVLMVIDRAAPNDTFVAQLGEDWEAQLAPGGPAMEAALQHLDGNHA